MIETANARRGEKSGCNPTILIAQADVWFADMALEAYLTVVRILNRV